MPGEPISLPDCELPHIAREAFVVKYPREQDHFRHTNRQAGEGSSPRLETCQTWKNFQRLWGDIYDASLDPTLWPGFFSRRAPCAEATPAFTDRLEKGGGEIIDIIKVPPKILRRSCNAHGVTDENAFSHHSA